MTGRAASFDRNRGGVGRYRAGAQSVSSLRVVDFVIVTRDTAEVVAVVELDDRTHRAEKDARRDAMTLAAGYRTIRIPGRPAPNLESVRLAVRGVLESTAKL